MRACVCRFRLYALQIFNAIIIIIFFMIAEILEHRDAPTRRIFEPLLARITRNMVENLVPAFLESASFEQYAGLAKSSSLGVGMDPAPKPSGRVEILAGGVLSLDDVLDDEQLFEQLGRFIKRMHPGE